MENPVPRRPPVPAAARQRQEHPGDIGGRLTLAATGPSGAMTTVRRVVRPTVAAGDRPHVGRGPTAFKGQPPPQPSPVPRVTGGPTGGMATMRRTRPTGELDEKSATRCAQAASVAARAARFAKLSASSSSTGTPAAAAAAAAAIARATTVGSGSAVGSVGMMGNMGMLPSGGGLGAAPHASTVGTVTPRNANARPVPAPMGRGGPASTTVATAVLMPITPPLEEKVAAQKVVRAEAAAWAEAAAAQVAVAEAAAQVAKGAANRAVQEEQRRMAAATAMAERRRPRAASCASRSMEIMEKEVELAVEMPTVRVPPLTKASVQPPPTPQRPPLPSPASSTVSRARSPASPVKPSTKGPPAPTGAPRAPARAGVKPMGPQTKGRSMMSTGLGGNKSGAGEGSNSESVPGSGAASGGSVAGSTTGSAVAAGVPGAAGNPRGRVWAALGVEATAAQRRAARRMAWAASQRITAPIGWAELPKELLLRIFLHFPEKELASRLSLVCRSWRQAARHPLLWRQLSFRGERVPTVVINRLLRTSPRLQTLKLEAVPDAPTIIRQLCRCNTDVRTVIVRDCTFGKDEVIPESVFRNLIMCCPKISKLDLQGTQFGALRFYQDIIKLPTLRSLNVGDNRFLKVQDLMALALNCKGLQQLQVARRPARPPFPQLTDHDAQYMFTHLKDSLLALSLDCVGLGDASLQAILKCSLLKKLELSNARDFSGREIRLIGTRLRHLTKLKLTHACQMRTADFLALFGASEPTSTTAGVAGSLPGTSGVSSIRLGRGKSVLTPLDDSDDDDMKVPLWGNDCLPLQGLSKVDLSSCWGLEDEGLKAVVNACDDNLETLCLKGCQTISTEGLRYIVDRCGELRHLNVAFALCSGASLAPLSDAPSALPRLRRLVVDMGSRRSPVLPRLKKNMPNLLILGSFSEYSDDESLLNFVSSHDQTQTASSATMTEVELNYARETRSTSTGSAYDL